jgi:excisionase family DNA binding protein
MSPAHAAQLKTVSRRTIMRAIESKKLQAFRDNRNQWKIDPLELDKWVFTAPRREADIAREAFAEHSERPK